MTGLGRWRAISLVRASTTALTVLMDEALV
jgi:hypothetical protein